MRSSCERGERAPISLRTERHAGGLAAYQGRQVIFGIRPEALTDPDGADRNATSLVTADCHIEVVEPAGSDTFAVTHLGGKEVVARLRADANIQPGSETPLAFNLIEGGVLRSRRKTGSVMKRSGRSIAATFRSLQPRTPTRSAPPTRSP